MSTCHLRHFREVPVGEVSSLKNGHTADEEASFPHRAVRYPPASGAGPPPRRARAQRAHPPLRCPTKGPSHIARDKRKKTARDVRLSHGTETLYARSAVSYGSAVKFSDTKALVFHRRCGEEETRCMTATPWSPMLRLQSDCPSGPNPTNSDIARTGSTKMYTAADKAICVV